MRQQRKNQGEGVERLTRQTRRLKAIVRGSLAILLVVVAACLAPAVALGAKAHVYQSSFGPDCTASTQFGAEEYAGNAAVAVDQQSHDTYVVDAIDGTIVRCAANGTPDDFTAGPGAGTNKIGGFSFEILAGLTQIAVDSSSHAFYVADGRDTVKAFEADGAPAIFTAGSSAGSNEITSFGGNPVSPADGVAVDANGDIYLSNGVLGAGAGAVDVYAATGEELTSFAAIEPANLAVNSRGDVYVGGFVFGAAGVTKFSPSKFPVTAGTTYGTDGVVDPEATYAIAVDPSNDDLFAVEHLDLFHSQIKQFNEAGEQLVVFPAAGEPGALQYSEGVAVDGATGNVYVADVNGQHQVEIFAPAPQVPPSIESSTATNVIATSADLQAQINPHLFDTHYHFEYLSDAQYEANGKTFVGASSTGSTDLGGSGKPQGAHAHVGGLAPDTTYRFRVVGENENGTAASPEPAPSFSTFAAFAPGLPDGRVYELVSPTHKAGEVIPPDPESGLGGSCDLCLPGVGSLQVMPMQSAPDGDAVAYVGQPFSAGLSSGANEYLAHRGPSDWEAQDLSSPLFAAKPEQGYNAFSSDLSRAVILQVEPALSPDAPTRAGKSFANLYLRDQGGSLQPLVTEAPEHRNPGLYNPFSPELENGFHIVFAGANSGTASVPAFSHVVFEANDALTPADPPNDPAAPIVAAAESDLYEWIDGQLQLVNVLPGNATALPGAVVGSGLLLKGGGEEGVNVDHAISADGSRIFWSDKASGQVYVRIDGRETKELKDHAGKFLTASVDGTKVLLSDGCLYDVAAEACEDLTQGQGGFEGILGAGDDLSHVYFIDTAVLTGGQENTNHELAEAGQDNLYAWSHGAATFVGRLLQGEGKIDGYVGTWTASPADRAAQVSPDGSRLAFMSRARLTGYDNEPENGACPIGNNGHACLEVFDYDAGSGQLACASCNPTGQRPLGQSNLSLIRPFITLPPLPQPGNLSADGRLFFESQDALSPQDTNGRIQDVYEWEPSGVGSCKRTRGCVFLISSGHSANDSMFMDATPSGDDAFFITRQQLLPQDKDDQLDLYDARVDGGLSGGGETTPCGGEACRGSAAGAPPSQPPASSVFSGPGNFALTLTPKPNVAPKPPTRAQKLAKALKACAKKPKRKRRACRAQAKERYGPIRAKNKSKSHKGAK